ncbi:hypothetical protein Calag_0690 [Caldisphaera lagunensis DSM 15908]|uniref:Uncharacterized protein n=1 Tax=Caldisphaera lagunensis (strain DSM 15908 / JCM 11604 / ANMR 0165 / IC-154) TaxID=1056495 RepID=L0ABL0_CALLD|nr:lantibiotic dehydratase C-terminal domain-containing protein [Caldisphaera lagunensis]AFZ70435.1 hypothetical protein Calag_0690 [Caldisphaera lagunensis DSM 15908]
MKWTEINVEVKNTDQEEIKKIFSKLIYYLVKEFKEMTNKRGSWHFLWESTPWPNTLKIRFYGSENAIDQIKKKFEEEYNNFKEDNKEILGEFIYGNNGVNGEEYEGEIIYYGVKGWKLVMKMLEFGSEIALELIRNKDLLESDEYSAQYPGSIDLYADRYVHLFLNQLSYFIKESEFLMKQLPFRYYVEKYGNAPQEAYLIETDIMLKTYLEKISSKYSQGKNQNKGLRLKNFNGQDA